MIRNALIPFLLLSACCSFAVLAQPPEAEKGAPPPPPPARMIPGINADDPFPQACVSCHINYVEMNMDTRLSTLMGHWLEEVDPKLLATAQACAPEGLTLSGKHPPIAGGVKEIPGTCLECHDRSSSVAPPFARMLHAIHLSGGDRNHFMTLFQGECTHCHKFDPLTAEWQVPSGTEP